MQQGAVITHWHDGYANIEQYYEGGYVKHLDVFERVSAIVTAMAVDSFGQRFNAKMYLGDNDQPITGWNVKEMDPA